MIGSSSKLSGERFGRPNVAREHAEPTQRVVEDYETRPRPEASSSILKQSCGVNVEYRLYMVWIPALLLRIGGSGLQDKGVGRKPLEGPSLKLYDSTAFVTGKRC